MTLLQMPFGIQPPSRGNQQAPGTLELEDLSIVVPVKDNAVGVRHFLDACLDIFTPEKHPREILLVDSLSCPPLTLPPHSQWGLPRACDSL